MVEMPLSAVAITKSTMPKDDDKNVTYKWMIGAVLTFVIAGGTFWMNWISGAIRGIDDTVDKLRIEQLERTARIATLEANYLSIQRELVEIKQTLKDLAKK